MKALTARQTEVLGFISSYIRTKKYAPAVRDLAEHFSISVKAAYDHLQALERKGQLRRAEHTSRGIEVTAAAAGEDQDIVVVPLLGNVAAGMPLLAEENLDGNIPVSARLIGSGPHFALRVCGDSMRNAGIMDGDVAIIRQRERAENGDIVVAMIEEAVTLKRFFLERNRARLEAENPAYPPIFTRNQRILGKLAAIVRSY
jgi:repressor LexA